MLKRLREDGIGDDMVRDRLVRVIPKPIQLSKDPATIIADAAVLIDLPAAEGGWTSGLREAEERLTTELSDQVLRKTVQYAREEGLRLEEAVRQMADATSDFAQAAGKKSADAERKHDKANAKLERIRDSSNRDEQEGFMRFFSFAVNQANASVAWNDRETSAYKRDVQAANRDVWLDVGRKLETIPQRLVTLEERLGKDAKSAQLQEATSDASIVRLGSISWKPLPPLADFIADNDVQPGMPPDLLVALTQGDEQAIELVEKEAREEGWRQAAELPLGALGKIHDGFQAAGRQMLSELGREGGEEPHLFQLAEISPTGQIPAIWPSVPQQAATIGQPQPTVMVGFIRIDRPVDVPQLDGVDMDREVGQRNLFVNLNLARRHREEAAEMEVNQE